MTKAQEEMPLGGDFGAEGAAELRTAAPPR
jgi:hypothetical protein